MSKPRRGDRNIGRSAGSLSPADAGLIANQHRHPTAFAVGHDLSALWACESSREKHFADGGRLGLTPIGPCPKPPLSKDFAQSHRRWGKSTRCYPSLRSVETHVIPAKAGIHWFLD